MRAIVLNGALLAEKILRGARLRAEKIFRRRGTPPRLGFVYGPGSPAAESFIKSKSTACAESGIEFVLFNVRKTLSKSGARRILRRAAQDPGLDALIVVKPIPGRLEAEDWAAEAPPEKDAEGLGPEHFGRLFALKKYGQIEEERLIVPATARAVAEILLEADISLAGKRAVVIGRSSILGKPAAHLLSIMDLTVTLCHSKTRRLREEIAGADVIVSAAGRAGLIRGGWIKKGAVVIDAGVNSKGGRLVGDVVFKEAVKKASFITPVPGGVGPVTTACLLDNVVCLAEKRSRLFTRNKAWASS